MKLKITEIIELFKALTELRGAPTIIQGQNGNKTVVYEPYPMSDKAKWNAAKNRGILKQLVNAHDEIIMDEQASLEAMRTTILNEVAKGADEDPTVEKEKMETAGKKIQEKVDECNATLRRISKEEKDVAGLLKIPARGLCTKGSKIPPTVVADLMPLLDGEPEFEEPKGDSK